MKINLSKSAKRALSLALAFAMLIGSLFTANVGINFKASAVTPYDVWDGSSIDTEWQQDAQGNYLITSAAELYGMVKNEGKVNGNAANFKVADGIKAFYLTDIKANIDAGDDALTIISAVQNSTNNWNKDMNYAYSTNVGFVGNFDGNGVTIYGMRTVQPGNKGGFIPSIVNAAGEITIKNVSFKYSYMKTNTNDPKTGVVVGMVGDTATTEGNSNQDRILTFDKVRVQDAIFEFAGTWDGQWNNYGYRGGLCARAHYAAVNVKNCFVSDIQTVKGEGNTAGSEAFATNGDCVASGFVFQVQDATKVTVTNSIDLTNERANAIQGTNSFNSTNSYSILDGECNKISAANLAVGAVAMANMPALDWSGTWFATNGYPEYRAFHNLTFSYVDTETHKYTCSDCTLTTAIPHSFVVNIEDETAICSDCGAQSNDVYDIWDGTKATSYAAGSGTKEDPYIIANVEQLFKMVRDEGVLRDADGNKIDKSGNVIEDESYEKVVPAYYKVADFVGALYINDTRSMTRDQFNSAAANKTLNNWSKELTLERSICTVNDCYYNNSDKNCSHKWGYVDCFFGNFDGNGVTIYGLYSETDVASYWQTGVGFVPALVCDATIKNVIFDTNYVKNIGGYVGVISSSNGFWPGQYNIDYISGDNNSYDTYAPCPKIEARVPSHEISNATILNVAVRNTYLNTTNESNVSYASGLVSVRTVPNSITFNSCLFDGTNSTFVTTATDLTKQAGIFSTKAEWNNSELTFCVNVKGNDNIDTVTPYETGTATTGQTQTHIFDCKSVTVDEFNITDMPDFNWVYWDNSEATITKYDTPMPVITSDWEEKSNNYYKENFRNISGSIHEGFVAGEFSDYCKLIGGGTEDDPYIISDAETLFAVIASGGTNRGIVQYYKLDCDIDLGGMQWVDTNKYTEDYEDDNGEIKTNTYYIYKDFAGIIDGDGHIVSGMFTCDNSSSAGFIPKLTSTGVVKNINFRNCYAYSSVGSSGVIAGNAESGATIENCSIENCKTTNYTGNTDFEPTNCYSIDANGNGGTILTEALAKDGSWYGIIGKNARLLSFAKAQPCADIDGNGIGEEYTSADVSALKNCLLRDPDYLYVYGDVSGNGKTNVSDLIALRREMKGDEWTALDGFWKNVKSGNIKIYYNDADNYDFARKLELYLEQVALGTDIEKVSNGTGTEFAINIVTSGNASDWSYNYDIPSAVLTITGGSFTAVEAAVDAFIANTKLTSNPENASGSINGKKAAITVNGGTYYYAWGDEFDTAAGDTDGDGIGTVSYDKWSLRTKGIGSTEFANVTAADDEQAQKINVVNTSGDGTLSLKRGINSKTSYYASGIWTKNSMLYKKGYVEMKATIPADGFAFPAFWMLTMSGHNNVAIDRSLYSKVYETNDYYNPNTSYKNNYYSNDHTSYKYKLPTTHLEIDILEVIQHLSDTLGYVSKSSNNKLDFNIHNWYTFSRTTQNKDGDFSIYILDWDYIDEDPESNRFDDDYPLLYRQDGVYKSDKNFINYNATNAASGDINSAINEFGGSTYDRTYSQINISKLISNGVISERRYGFLWDDTNMTFVVYDCSSATYSSSSANGFKDFDGDGASDDFVFNVPISVLKEMSGLGEFYTTDQYAHILIENSFYTASQDGNAYSSQIPECDMNIDYVRVYQLDGERDIVTPESEREFVLAR